MDCGMGINWVLIEVQRHYAIIKLLVLSKKMQEQTYCVKIRVFRNSQGIFMGYYYYIHVNFRTTALCCLM